jgi:RHS repeat-associated protein
MELLTIFSQKLFQQKTKPLSDDVELGDEQDYGLRSYGKWQRRFWSVDPLFKAYVYYSPYQFAGNTPIQAIDIEGSEEYKVYRTRTDRLHIELTVEYIPSDKRIESKVGANDANRKADYLINNGPTIPKEKFTSPTAPESYIESNTMETWDKKSDMNKVQGTPRVLKEGYNKTIIDSKGQIGEWKSTTGTIELPGDYTLKYNSANSESGFSQENIDKFAQALINNPEIAATITGNTSRKGTPEENKKLSQARADFIKEKVLESARKQGASEDQVNNLKTRITSIGKGEEAAKAAHEKEKSDLPDNRTTTISIDKPK